MIMIDVSILRQPNGKPTPLAEAIEIPDCLEVLDGTQQPAPGQRAFRVLSPRYGDQRITWSARSLAEIRAAKKLFLELVKKGLTPYKVGGDGKKSSHVMRKFDPRAEEVIFLPAALVAGG